ncbi:MAG: hypothetical protein UH542_06260, partial [Bacteroidales bacterium]|nr:hypothetical protein [Bacteroidales bacterium]
YQLVILPVSVSDTAGINKGNILQNLLCDFANFARGKPKFARKSFGGIRKFLYFCTCILSDIKKAFLLILGFSETWTLSVMFTNKISGKRPRAYRGLFLFW